MFIFKKLVEGNYMHISGLLETVIGYWGLVLDNLLGLPGS